MPSISRSSSSHRGTRSNTELMTVVKSGTPEGVCLVISINPFGGGSAPLPIGNATPQVPATTNYAVVTVMPRRGQSS